MNTTIIIEGEDRPEGFYSVVFLNCESGTAVSFEVIGKALPFIFKELTLVLPSLAQVDQFQPWAQLSFCRIDTAPNDLFQFVCCLLCGSVCLDLLFHSWTRVSHPPPF